MKRNTWHGLIGLFVAAAALTPAAWGGDDPNANDDVKTTIQLLQRRLHEQDTRIAELEGRPSPLLAVASTAATREETLKVAREMSADAAKQASDFKIVWNNGIWIKSEDGQFAFHAGGRFFSDWGWVRAKGMERDNPNLSQTSPKPSSLDLRDGEEFRLVRLWGEGTMYKYVQYKLEVDFAGNAVVLKDAYMRLTELPLVGNFTVGHFKEPFCLDELTSDAALTFMERALPDILAPMRNPGFMFSSALLGEKKSERMTYAIGLFRQEAIGDTGTADGTAVYSERGYALTSRVTGLPYFETGGERLVHLGLAYSVRGTNDDHSLRYRARPEAHFLQYRFIDTGALVNIDHVQLLGAEAATVLGPFSMQSEFVSALVDFDSSTASSSTATRNVCFNSVYVQASYFLTPGDKRNYSTGSGTFAPVVPKKNFRQDNGWGAVEVATRYSYLDLDQESLGATSGTGRGELRDWTLGVNWYLNPNVRIMANYILALPKRVETEEQASIFMMRFQLDF